MASSVVRHTPPPTEPTSKLVAVSVATMAEWLPAISRPAVIQTSGRNDANDICLDIGGPASQITPETGFAAPATTPEEAVMAMAGFLGKINRDRRLLAAMSAKAREHVQHNFAMRRINETMRSFYDQALAAHAQSGRDLSA